MGEFCTVPLSSELGPYTATGSSGAIAANRVSYALGLTGPSISVDTACSSALVAIQVASYSLLARTCTGGVVSVANALLSPKGFLNTCNAHMLSPRGRCHTFDASADGYVRAEGCCAVVVTTADTDVTVQVASTAVNQDGRTANLTSPNGPAQQQVIALALQLAIVRRPELPLVECHGTGTALGDPIEVSAQRAMLGEDRRIPLMIGAVKSNVGHLEAGAGLVGVLKLVLALQRGHVPASLHLKRKNPHIDTAHFAVVMSSEMLAAVESRSLVAGTSSFGFGGTNSHAVLRSLMEPVTTSACVQATVQYQRTRFAWWVSVIEDMPLLGVLTTALSAASKMVWERSWPSATCSFLAHHRVGCTPVTPGTGYLCMAREAVTTATSDGCEVSVCKAQFRAMMFLDEPQLVVCVCVEPEGEQQDVSIESSVVTAEWVQHAFVVTTAVAEVEDSLEQRGQAALVHNV